MSRVKNITFAWPGLPEYACRSIRAVIDQNLASVSVVATQARVPISGLEQ